MSRWPSCSGRRLADDKGEWAVTDDAGLEPREPQETVLEDLIRRVGSEVGFDPELAIEAARSEDTSLPTLADLERVESRLWMHFSGVAPTLGGDFPHAQLVAWAWVSVAYRQAHAAFILYKQGFPDAASANARAAVEHGVYLSLLAVVDSVDRVLNPLEGVFVRNVAKMLAGADEDVPEFLSRMVEDIAGPLAGCRDRDTEVFQRVCGRLETGDEVYRHYRKLSSDVHAGFGSAAPFFLAAFGDQDLSKPVLSNEPAVGGPRGTLWLALGGCAWAGWSADRLFEAEYFGPLLDSTVRDMDFMPLVLKSATDRGAPT